MKKLLAAIGVLALFVGWAGAQTPQGDSDFTLAPGMVYVENGQVVPVMVRPAAGNSGEVLVKVYDIYGRQVWDTSGRISDASYIKWYGTTNGGRRVDPGQYLLTVQTVQGTFRSGVHKFWVGVIW